MKDENYFKDLMVSGYEVLIEDTVLWPESFTLEQKLSLLQAALNYFQLIEDYAKCALLQKKIKSLTKTKRSYVKQKKNSN